MAQSVCRKDAKTAATFRQRSAESVAKTWKKSVLPFCSKLCNGCFSPSCAGGKNLKISIILCYGCHNYHCYHDHHIILLYIEMRIGVFVFESSSLGEASTCCRHKSLYIRPNTTLLCKIQMRICVQTETNTQLTIFKKGGEIQREQWRIRKLSIVQINLHKHCISIDFSIHICTEPHQ